MPAVVPAAMVGLVVGLLAWFAPSPLSYAPGMPGGLFAPLLLVGAAASALLAGAVNAISPDLMQKTDFAVVGMAASSPPWCAHHLLASFSWLQ